MILSKKDIELRRKLIADAPMWDTETKEQLMASHEELRAQRDEAARLLCQACTIPDGVGEFLAKLAT